MKSKKASTPIAITILVVMTLILTGTTIYLFITDNKNVSGELSSATALNYVYVQEDLFNFYLEQGLSKEEAVKYIDKDAKLIGEEVEIIKKFENMEIIYRFKPKV